MGKKTDPKTIELICDLKRQGFTRKEIIARTGVKEGTVKDILRKNGLTRNEDAPTPSDNSRTPARDINDDSNPPMQSNHPVQPPVGNNALNTNLTEANTSHEIIQYVQFFRSRTKRLPFEKLSDHDKVWAEGNYGKRWADGIKMMIDTTGLSAESLMAAIDDYETDLTDALDRFNSKYRTD